jgi:predicted RNA-binding Zn ribbon-like protein
LPPVEQIDYLSGVEPAPGRLALLQRFLNTVAPELNQEMLHSPQRLRDVLTALGLMSAAARVSADDLRQALELREAFRALALANNGAGAAPEAEYLVEQAAAGALGIHFFDGVPRLVSDESGVAGALATLAAVVAEAAALGTWPRLKACPAEACGWIFYDRSRNRSGRWCDSTVCGNRAKTRAYRRRRRAQLGLQAQDGTRPDV